VLTYAGHASYDADVPLKSALLVSPSAASGVDRVEARAVVGLGHRLDLVLLLGCATSRLWEARGFGDEIMGLQRAFLVGGARHVVGALWPVVDRDAEDFAGALLQSAGSSDAVMAVAAAQRCLASRACPARGIATWASFMIDAR
jgi:CHAT domain-containing protein